MADFKSILQKHGALPRYDDAQILSGSDSPRLNILLGGSSRDVTTGKRRKLKTLVSCKSSDGASSPDVSEFTYEEAAQIVMSAANPYVDGETIIFWESYDKDNTTKKYYVERWSRNNVEQSIDITEAQGAFYPPDGSFGYISFMKSRPSRIAYVAEKKADKDEGTGKYKYDDTWGEGYGERKSPVIVTLDFQGGLSEQTNSVSDNDKNDSEKKPENKGMYIVLNPEENTTCAQPIFSPTTGKLIWVGWSTLPRRYGAKFCFNRPSYLVESAYDGTEFRRLTGQDRHIRSPYLGPNNNVYYLNNPTGGGHDQCTQLSRISLQSLDSTIVVPIVQTPTEEFTGLFTVGIAGIYGHQLFLTSQHRSTRRALKFDLKESSPKPTSIASQTDSDESWDIIGCSKGQVVLARHSMYGETAIEHYSIDRGVTTPLINREPIKSLAEGCQAGVVTYPERPYMESILLLPTKNSGEFYKGHAKPPAIIFPHGGPHVSYATSHDVFSATLVECGIAILQVNYHGSLGFGQEGVDKLVGRIGDLDVEDVKFARDHLEGTGVVDKDRIAVMGGSHGGFLTAWTVGKFPDSFKCGILRNPVIDLASMVGVTDIPDWCFNELSEDYDFAAPTPVSPDQYAKIYSASPISVAKNVKVPVLLSLGGKDRRVPNSQGQYYYKFLRGQGHKNVRAFWYPEDGHSLDSQDAFRLGLTAIVDFLREYL